MQHSLCHSILSISELHCPRIEGWNLGSTRRSGLAAGLFVTLFQGGLQHCPEGWNLGSKRRSHLATGLVQDSVCVTQFRVDCSASKDGTWVPHGHDGHRSHQDSCRIFFSLNFRVSAASQDASWGQDDGQASQQQDPCRILDCILHCTGPKDGSWGQDDRGPWQQDS